MEELREKMHRLENIGKKVDKIEYTDIKEIRSQIRDLQLDLTKNNVLTEKNTEAMNNMSNTMEHVRETMVQLSGAVECISRTNQELATNLKQQNVKIDEQNVKIDELRARQDEYEEKGKFDILLFLKKNFVTIIVACGVLGYLFLK